jgi:6-phosphogluconolactonase
MRVVDPEIRIVKDIDELTRAAAGELIRSATEAVRRQGRCAITLAGGTTPRKLYHLLATQPTFRTLLPWAKTHFFWGDERCVPPQHPESNYHAACEAMLDLVPIPPENIHRIPAEQPDPAAAYAAELQSFFALQSGQLPRFDLVLLGMAPDGHIAALSPESEALRVADLLATATRLPGSPDDWVTLTLPVLNNAATVMFLAGGKEKAEILREVLRRVQRPVKGESHFPAALIQPTNGRLIWIVDQEASRLIALGR